MVRARTANLYPINPSGKRWDVLWVAMVEVPCPGLLRKGVLQTLGVNLRLGDNKIEMEGNVMPLHADDEAHPDLILIHKHSNLAHAPTFTDE